MKANRNYTTHNPTKNTHTKKKLKLNKNENKIEIKIADMSSGNNKQPVIQQAVLAAQINHESSYVSGNDNRSSLMVPALVGQQVVSQQPQNEISNIKSDNTKQVYLDNVVSDFKGMVDSSNDNNSSHKLIFDVADDDYNDETNYFKYGDSGMEDQGFKGSQILDG